MLHKKGGRIARGEPESGAIPTLKVDLSVAAFRGTGTVAPVKKRDPQYEFL